MIAIIGLIERYHYVLKSGCKIEELQLETAKRINMALATYSIGVTSLYILKLKTDCNCISYNRVLFNAIDSCRNLSLTSRFDSCDFKL